MSATEERASRTPEEWEEQREEWRRERQETIREVLHELMEKRGIENLEELHRRFLETEHAHIPVPGLHTGKPVSFEVFERCAYGRSRMLYRESIWGMEEVLDLDPQSEEAVDFALAHTWGERRST